jgi:fucose 4-O-acetylase-like acetyltransferase
MLATAFFLSGYACKKQKIKIEGSLSKVLVFMVVPIVLSFFFYWQMLWGLSIYEVIPYYLTAMLGTLGTLQFSAYVSRNRIFNKMLTYVGERTLYILTFHFVGFKILSLVFIYMTDIPKDYLADFPVMGIEPSWFWICYVISALLFSLSMHRLLARYV